MNAYAMDRDKFGLERAGDLVKMYVGTGDVIRQLRLKSQSLDRLPTREKSLLCN